MRPVSSSFELNSRLDAELGFRYGTVTFDYFPDKEEPLGEQNRAMQVGVYLRNW